MIQKIIIFGFSHCGTTILKSIIGHIESVYEIIEERFDVIDNKLYNFISNNKNIKFIVQKSPIFREIFLSKEYNDYIKIFIIRNPLYVYSSLNRRTNNNITKAHDIDKFMKIIEKYDYYLNNPIDNLYTIKYEDLFENNYKKFKDILNKIGLEYTDKIFNNHYYENKCSNKLYSNIEDRPCETDNDLFRLWQINQEFKNLNIKTKINLNSEYLDKIINNKYVLNLYPNIKDDLN